MPDDAPALAQKIIERIKANDLDEAEKLLAQMHDAYPQTRDVPVFEVVIALMRGWTLDALRIVNGLPDGRSPELKAICLKVLGDPLWQGYATAHEESDNPYVRLAMRSLLGKD